LFKMPVTGLSRELDFGTSDGASGTDERSLLAKSGFLTWVDFDGMDSEEEAASNQKLVN